MDERQFHFEEILGADSALWLKKLTPPELGYWRRMRESEKEWWYANTKPRERKKLLRAEMEDIAMLATANKIHYLPKKERDAIFARWNKEADEASIGIEKFLAAQRREDEMK